MESDQRSGLLFGRIIVDKPGSHFAGKCSSCTKSLAQRYGCGSGAGLCRVPDPDVGFDVASNAGAIVDIEGCQCTLESHGAVLIG
jgi:hypothetical protein